MPFFIYLSILIALLYAQPSTSIYRHPVTMHSNFNAEKSSSGQHSPIRLQQPLPLPIILTNPGEYKSNRPLFQKYSLRKYQLYDTNYLPDLSKITRLDEELAYNMEPPAGVFEQSSKIVIENYRLLQPWHITKPIKFKVENGTIALIPQISRFQSSYTKTIEYLNLVSTYKEPYRIKSIESNASNLMVYSNNHSEIYQNQWIGMALIYEPFWAQWNITQDCCSERKGIERLFKELTSGGNRPISVQITLKTTTELQANALVLIDRSSAPLIELPYSHQFSTRQKFRKDAERIDIHLIEEGNVDKFEYKLKIKNIFEEPLKGNMLMFDQELIERLDEYMEYRHKMNDKVTVYFCLRNDVKVKHNFSPSLIKSLFQLTSLPVQITVQPLTNTSFYINSPMPPRQQVVDSLKFSQYFKQTINSGSRMCYRFESALYVRNLIETGVINWFSEEYRYEILSQFVRKQFEQLQSSHSQQSESHGVTSLGQNSAKQIETFIKYNLRFQQFFFQHYIDKEQFCKGQRNLDKMTSFFKFCQHINIKIKYLQTKSNRYERKQQKTVVRLQQCSTNTFNDPKKQNRQCKKDLKENGRRVKKTYQKQVNRYFLLPPTSKNSSNSESQGAAKKNELELGFQIFPIKNRAPIFTFATGPYRATIQNPALQKQGIESLKSEQDPQNPSKRSSIYQTLSEQEQQPLFLTSPSFYLVLLNNYTSYQLYHQTIQISKPKLRIKSVIISGQKIQKRQFQDNYFGEQFSLQDVRHKQNINLKQLGSKGVKNKKATHLSERNRWLPIYIEQSQIARITSPQQMLQKEPSTNQPSSQLTEDDHRASDQSHLKTQSLNFQLSIERQRHLVKDLLLNGQIENLYVQGQKVFQIANQGQADISYTHIGFQNQENTCAYKGLQILTGPCTQQWTPLNYQKDKNASIDNLKQPKATGQKETTDNAKRAAPLIQHKMLPKSLSLIKIRYRIAITDLLFQNQAQRPDTDENTGVEQEMISPTFNIYFYNSQSYYIRLVVKFKFSKELSTLLKSLSNKDLRPVEDDKWFVTKIWNLSLHIMALIFVCLTILKFRQADEITRKQLLKRKSQQIGSSNISNGKLQYSVNSVGYQKGLKRLRSKSQFYTQQMESSKQEGEVTYQIIQPSTYVFTIGTPIVSKASSQYHPIVTISDELLNAIKHQQKKESRMLHNFFNESEQSQILARNEHQINENISLTINLDQDVTQNEQHANLHNESASEDSSFDFQIRNTSHSHDQQIGKHEKSHVQQSEGSGSDFSQASLSDLPQGQEVQVTDQILNQSDEGFGFQSESKKKPHSANTSHTQEEQNQGKKQKQGYYNVFLSQNPLKKGKEQGKNGANPFSWMNQNKKRSRLNW